MQLVDSSFGRSLFVLGGARSGKSRHAQAMAEAAGLEIAGEVAGVGAAAEETKATADDPALVYVATAQAFDGEMADRITRHRADRDDRWRTVEAPFELADALLAVDGANTVILVDCLTLWLSNLLLAEDDCEARTDVLLDTVSRLTGRIIFVSNEVGLGIVPDNALARRFRDAAGRLHQRLAAQVESVDMVMAGLVQRWKSPITASSHPAAAPCRVIERS